MHVVLPFAASASEAGAQALHSLRLPQLETLLAMLQAGPTVGSDQHSLNLPHEQALAQAWGWTGRDGRLPFAAVQARADGVPVEEGAGSADGWGLLTPTHWQVGREQIVLCDPHDLALDAAESRALLQAVRPLFESEGWALHWGAPLRWYARHGSLRDIATASLDRVIGAAIDAWLPDRQAARQVRRLQSEVQMLLHTHALNDQREERGAMSVNSFWLSGTGATAELEADPADIVVDLRLRTPLLAGDWAGWADAWHAFDAQRVPELAARVPRGQPFSLTLCGERRSQRFDSRPLGRWSGLLRRWQRRAVAPLLETL